jgi:pSer/pThr/pTyr-binding forkhead associated (FHA) protein
MTPRLQVTEGKRVGSELLLQGKAIFEVGSGKSADLQLDDDAVAPVHFKIYCASTEYSVFDASGQGFLHNGKRSLKAAVLDGDHIQVGSHVLRLSTGSPVPATPAPATPPPASIARCELQAVRGSDAGRTYDLLQKEMFIIGRGVATDITVWDIRVSRVHCRIDKDARGYLITDLNASNGTYVNGQKIERHRLQSGDEIKVGSTVLQYVQR